jgi:hypothetical protein
MLTDKITKTYENLQIVQSQFFTDKVIFDIFDLIQYNLNIYLFISIQI